MKTILLFLICLPAVVAGDAADPFDPERAHRFPQPGGLPGISGAKVLGGGTDPVRASMLMRTDLQGYARKAGIEVERITPKKPRVIDAEKEIIEVPVNINLIGGLEGIIAFFEEMDRSNRGYKIDRIDLSRHTAPVEEEPDPLAEETGSTLFARIKLLSLSQRRGEAGEWPEGTEAYRMVGVIPALIHGLGRGLPRNAWLTEIQVKNNRVTIQGRTHRSNAETYFEVLEEIPFLVDIGPEKPDTIGRVASKILFAGSALIDLSLF